MAKHICNAVYKKERKKNNFYVLQGEVLKIVGKTLARICDNFQKQKCEGKKKFLVKIVLIMYFKNFSKPFDFALLLCYIQIEAS